MVVEVRLCSTFTILWAISARPLTPEIETPKSAFILMTEQENQEPPHFFNLLSACDQDRYNALRAALSSSDCRNNRNQRLDKFQEMLSVIREFCEHSHEDRAARYLVCGVCHLGEGIAINIRQLRLLLNKCKSSINGSFQRMGWIGLPLKDGTLDEFLSKIPFLRTNFGELREWSVRGYRPFSPQAQKFSQIPGCVVAASVAASASASASPWTAPQEPAIPTPPPSLGEVGSIPPQSHAFYNPWNDDGDDPFCLKPTFFDGGWDHDF
jgi:hypothetical protein